MKNNVEFEFSAGGIVKRDSEVLLIKTKDLKGNEVWTFPKGKIEKGEKSKEAALRESDIVRFPDHLPGNL